MFIHIVFSIGITLFVMILVLKLVCKAKYNLLETLPNEEDANEKHYLLAITSSGVLLPIILIIFEFLMLVLAIYGIITENKFASVSSVFIIGITTLPILEEF